MLKSPTRLFAFDIQAEAIFLPDINHESSLNLGSFLDNFRTSHRELYIGNYFDGEESF